MSYRSFAYEKFPNPLSKNPKDRNGPIKVGDLCRYYDESDEDYMYVRVQRIETNEEGSRSVWGYYTPNEDGYLYDDEEDDYESWMPENQLEIVERV